jgi:hypothetical protein
MTLRHVAYECTQLNVKYNFVEIKLGKVNKTHGYNCQNVPYLDLFTLCGLWSIQENVILETKEFSCFYDKCVDDIPKGDWESQSPVVP